MVIAEALNIGNHHFSFEPDGEQNMPYHELGKAATQYATGKQYLTRTHVEKDIQKAEEMFTKSAEQENLYAQYRYR